MSWRLLHDIRHRHRKRCRGDAEAKLWRCRLRHKAVIGVLIALPTARRARRAPEQRRPRTVSLRVDSPIWARTMPRCRDRSLPPVRRRRRVAWPAPRPEWSKTGTPEVSQIIGKFGAPNCSPGQQRTAEDVAPPSAALASPMISNTPPSPMISNTPPSALRFWPACCHVAPSCTPDAPPRIESKAGVRQQYGKS
eukprot:SAG31_NODE_4589_length_3107_cov_2.071120_1_plen_194_part_00